MSNIVAIIQIIFLAVCSVPVLYLLGLTLAAALYRKPPVSQAGSASEHFAILIPAHDEALTLRATLSRVVALRAGPDAPEPVVIVVADNCSDATATIARDIGAIVYERSDPAHRSKGHALEWAIARMQDDPDLPRWTALAIFDADTVPDSAFLVRVEAQMRAGAQVVQGRYSILNAQESPRTRLLVAAFALYNHVRPLGRRVLGLSDGLRGNGMVFRRAVLERVPWQATTLVEDIEFTTRLVTAGLSVTYVPEALIYAQAAATRKQATSQRLRWESGRLAQARHDVPPLLGFALRRQSFAALDRAMDLLIPPLAMLVMLILTLSVCDTLAWFMLGGGLLGTTVISWAALLFGLIVFVFGGLGVARTPLSAYRALLYAPGYVLWKLWLYLSLLRHRMPHEWVRTARSQIELADDLTEIGM